jgi:hypothetical protein
MATHPSVEAAVSGGKAFDVLTATAANAQATASSASADLSSVGRHEPIRIRLASPLRISAA